MGRHGKLRLYRDDPARETRVIWYVVPYDRPELGFSTIFGNRIWEWDHIAGELGDVPGFGRFYGGGPPNSADGTHVCGTEDQWLNGCRTTDPLPAVDPETGAPVCCGVRRFLGMGGAILGAPSQTHFLLQQNFGRILLQQGGRLLWE